MRVLLATLALACPALAQLSVGLRGGVPITEAYEARQFYKSVPRHYLFGPTVEVRLPFRFAITADLLYRKLEYENSGQSVTSTMWEFPVLVRYRFGQGDARPFIAAGPTFNKITGVAVRDPAEFVKSSAAGIVFGAGIELRAIIRLTPEIRITHRGSENFKDPTGALLKSKLTQADLLLGITW